MKNSRNAMLTAVVLMFGATNFSYATTVEGKIEGAECYLHKTDCVQSGNDPRLILQNDFVLVSGERYYFLPNLPRSEKMNAYNETVSIEGSITGQQIVVERMLLKEGNAENIIWDEQSVHDELYDN